MPQRSIVHRPRFSRATAEAQRERKREVDRRRPNAHDRGYDAEWQSFRADFIAANSICSVTGCGKPTSDVDHIKSVRDRPDLRLVASNCRPFCHAHHSSRTAREQGFAPSKPIEQRGALHPSWLRPSRVPFTVVCGPPAAGKSSYVEARRQPKELVLDLDEIMAKLAKRPLYEAGIEWRDAALRSRNARLGMLSSLTCPWRRAWLIVGEPSAHRRLWWQATMKPQSIVVLETPPAICEQRILDDPRRAHRHNALLAAVQQWWRLYERRSGDIIV